MPAIRCPWKTCKHCSKEGSCQAASVEFSNVNAEDGDQYLNCLTYVFDINFMDKQ